MRIHKAGRLAALGLGLAVATGLAQSPPRKYNAAPTTETSQWWRNLFKSSEAPKVSAAPPAGVTVADKHAELGRLEKSYMRRVDACLRLQEIASHANDDALFNEALELQEIAGRLYQARARQLGLSVASAEPEPAAKPEESTLDVLKKATKGGQLPPRLQRPGGREEPARASRGERMREDE